jgi:hypothetical protein
MSEELRISFMVPTGSSFEDAPDGSLIVHGVPAMCEGEWKSAEGKVVQFGKPDLKANCANWYDNGIWTRHPLMPGENRPADLCVGGVQNPTYTDSFKTVLEDGTVYQGAAVIGDLVFHRQTDASKDAAVQIRLPKDQGGFRMVSAEIIMQSSEFDAKAGVYHPTKYAFGGLTIQRKGGCKACNIPAFAQAAPGQEIGNMAEEPKPAIPAPPAPGGAGEMPAWAKVLSDKLDKLIEMETAEAAEEKGEPTNECNKGAGMAAQAPRIESFAAVEAKVKDLEAQTKALIEDKRVLTAKLEKADSKQAPTGNFSAPEPKINTEGVSSSRMVLSGTNMKLSRGG